MGKPFIPWRVFYLFVTVLVSSQAQTVSPGPNAFENVCEDAGLSDNLSCETEDDSMACFPRAELCSGAAFCRDGADEGNTTKTGLDCDGRLTGRKPDNTGRTQPGFLCRNGSIIDIDQMCDGTAHCADGDDETDYLCANKCMAPYYGGCPYTRECTSTVETATCGNCRPGFARDPSNFTIGECVEATFRLCQTTYTVRCEGYSVVPYICLETTGILDQVVVFNMSTVDGNATAGEDYVSQTEEVMFAKGVSHTSRGFSWPWVDTISDSIPEATETFYVVASASTWSITSRATVTIMECSSSGGRTYPLVTVRYSYVTEGPDAVLTTTVQLAHGVGTLEEDIVVDVTTSGHSYYGASGDVDYVETNSTITFINGAEGGATMEFSVPIIDDNIAEHSEYFTIKATVRGNGIGRFNRTTDSASAYIDDDDAFKVAFEHSEYTVMEGDVTEVCLVGVTNPERIHPFTVYIHTTHDYDNATKDATADLDYEALYERVQVLFPPESYRECVTIQTYHDGLAEPPEKFLLWAYTTSGLGRLSKSPMNASVIIQSVNIDPVTVSIEESSYTITEPENFTEVCVRAKGMLDQPVTLTLEHSTGTVRLFGGSNVHEGRVEVFSNGAWGTVCDDLWDINDAMVVCNQLGYGAAIRAQHSASYGHGTGQIVLDDLRCVGNESSLFDCPHRGVNIHNCGHHKDAGVECERGIIKPDRGNLTLSSTVSRSCTTFTFDMNGFKRNGHIVLLQASILSNNKRITTGRMITEVVLLGSDNPDQCPQLYNPQNELSLSTDLLSPGSVATYSCDVGFVLKGTRFRVCMEDYTWSGELPTCEQETMGELTSSSNELIIGFSTSLPFAVVTTADTDSVHYVVTEESFSNSRSRNNRDYTSFSVLSQDKGVHIKAEVGKKVTVYGWEQSSYQLDAFLAFSIANSVNTYEYYSIPYNHTSSLLIVAQEDDTFVTLPSSTIVLDRFKTYKVQDISPRTTMRLESNKPLSVTSAKTCSQSDCDYLVEQLLPTHLWGRTFLVASFSGPKTGESIRVISSRQSTSATITCADSNFQRTISGLDAGHWMDIEIDQQGRDRFCVVEASAPVYVLQYAEESVGGSYMMTIPAIEQYGTSFTGFYTPNRSPSNYINVYVTPEHFAPLGILVNGAPVQDWTEVQCFNGTICGYISRSVLRNRFPYSEYHTVQHVDPQARIGFSAYGFNLARRTSYGYPGSLEIPSLPQNFDECLPEDESLICGPNSVCINPNGYYECKAICPDLPTLINGMLIKYSPNTTPRLEGTVATHSCDFGHELSGGAVRTCQSSSTWSGESITCEALDCGPPTVPSNGQVALLSGTTTLNSLATYSCDSCYELEGASTRICVGDSQWLPTVPSCQIISDCGRPASVLNGNVHTSPNTECGSVATYSCDNGYELEGESEHTCQPDGRWSGDQPVCTPVDCGRLIAPTNGQVATPSGTTFRRVATYSCNRGYRIVGTSSQTCETDGRWGPASAPTCEPIDCGPLSNLANGEVDSSSGTTFRRVATYSCNTCYDLLGARSRTCTASGVWSPAAPSCQIVDCGALVNPENGLVSTQSGTTCTQQATYSCLEGYILTGSPTRTCTASGQWTLSAPTCPPVNCGELHTPSNGHVDTSNGTLFQSTATFSCDPGYNLTGCAVAECLSNDSWSCKPPFCADNTLIQLKISPARRCDEWTEKKVDLMYYVMYSSIQKAIQGSGHVIPKENIQRGYFSCYRSESKSTYRTMITGTERVSAVDYAALIQQWVDSGVTTRVLWYVIKFDKNCPVSISSMEDDECE